MAWARSVQGHWRRDALAPVGDDVRLVTFEPGAPKFKATRLRDAVRAATHVLETIGAYSTLACLLHIFKWLRAGAPDARTQLYQVGAGVGENFESSTDDLAFAEAKAQLLLHEAAKAGITRADVANVHSACATSILCIAQGVTAVFCGAAPPRWPRWRCFFLPAATRRRSTR